MLLLFLREKYPLSMLLVESVAAWAKKAGKRVVDVMSCWSKNWRRVLTDVGRDDDDNFLG